MNVKLQSLWRLTRITENLAFRGITLPLDDLRAAKLPAKRRYWLNRQLDAIAKESLTLEQVRLELFKKYGKEILTGEHSRIEIEPGSPEEKGFWDELTPLLETEIEIPGEQFSIEELGNAEFSGDAIDAVGFLFTENE